MRWKAARIVTQRNGHKALSYNDVGDVATAEAAERAQGPISYSGASSTFIADAAERAQGPILQWHGRFDQARGVGAGEVLDSRLRGNDEGAIRCPHSL